MIHIYLDDQLTVRRLKTVSGNRKSFQATATVWGDVQEIGAEEAEAIGLHATRAFKIYVDIYEDVKSGDKLTFNEEFNLRASEYTQNRHFIVKQIDIPKNWMAEYKILVCEELID